jgi:flagellar biosynthesis component FlhA
MFKQCSASNIHVPSPEHCKGGGLLDLMDGHNTPCFVSMASAEAAAEAAAHCQRQQHQQQQLEAQHQQHQQHQQRQQHNVARVLPRPGDERLRLKVGLNMVTN